MFSTTVQRLAAIDKAMIARANKLQADLNKIQASNYTGTWTECLYNNAGDFTAVANVATESTLLAGINEQAIIPAGFFLNPTSTRRVLRVNGRGVLSTTGTPTLIFQARTSTTAGSATLSGASLGVSAAITTSSGVTNKYWELVLDITCQTPGLGTGNCTLKGAGYVMSPSGFGSPFIFPLEITTPDTGTWTQTIDGSLTQYLNLSVTWSAANASNTITLKQLLVLGFN